MNAVGMDFIIDLGQHVDAALKANNDVEMYRHGNEVRRLLVKCGLDAPARIFESTIGKLISIEQQYDGNTLGMIKHHLVTIAHQAMDEAKQKQMIVLASHNVSKQLLVLPTQRVLTDTQNRLLEDPPIVKRQLSILTNRLVTAPRRAVITNSIPVITLPAGTLGEKL
jgi:hypothetical protein